MNDYLANLLARSFAPAADVRPRIPSIFEPPPGPALLDHAVDFEADTESPAVPPVSLPRAAPALPEPPGWPEPSAPAPVSPRRPETTSPGPTVAAPTGVSTRPPPDTPLVPAAVGPASPHAVPRAETVGPAPSSRVRPPAGIEPVAARTMQPPAPSASPDWRNTREHDSVPPLLRVSSSRPRPADSTAVGIGIRPFRPAREATGIPTPISARRAAGRLPPAPAPAALPAIQVTIGRVEVRASTPAIASRAKSKKEPEISLETYLQRRAEGGRR